MVLRIAFWPMSLFHRRQVRRNTRCRMFCPVESNLYFQSHCQPDDPVHYYTSLTWMTGHAMLFPQSNKIQLYIIYDFYCSNIFARDYIYFLEIQFAKFYCFCLETLFIKFYNQAFLILFQDITHSDDPLRTHHLMRPLTRTIERNVYDIR